MTPPLTLKEHIPHQWGVNPQGQVSKICGRQDVNEAYLDKIIDKYPMLVDFIGSIEATHSKAMKAYITYMTQRLIEMHRILKDTGSLYLHCDPTASHYLKIVLDRIFGRRNFKNEIIWHYQAGTKSKKFFGRKHDVILVYGKSDKAIHNRIGKPVVNPDRYKYTDEDGRRYDVNGQGKRYYLAEGQTCDDVWTYTQEKQFQQLNSQSKERTGYPTQKPLALLHRIIKASSKEGDLVLDPFCGCATTCVAAQQLNRKWIGIDIEKQAVNVLMDRLSDDAGLFRDFIQRSDIPQRTDIQIELISQNVKERLFKEQKGKCNACDNEMRIVDFEVDHIIPKSKGGGDYYENYQLLCGYCNRVKGNKPMEYLVSKLKTREKLLEKKVFG